MLRSEVFSSSTPREPSDRLPSTTSPSDDRSRRPSDLSRPSSCESLRVYSHPAGGEILALTPFFFFFSFFSTDEHGEVCPASWTPENSDSIKPSVAASKEYFSKQ